MELQVHKQDGTEAGRTVALDEDIFGITPNDHVVWLDVRRIQAQGRQGTHKTKERGEVAGSTRKLYRQKGTGNARAGSAKSPIRKTGGRTFGPRPRTYSLKLNKKTKRLARRSALTYKARENALRVIEDFSMEAPSTKQFLQMLTAMDLTGKKVLLLTADHHPAFVNSCRNVPKVNVLEARNASTLDLLGANVVLLQEGALDTLSKTLN
ncbi:MAG: 50S ribosomal protein L4 [Acidiferrobacterales bacterium]|nr:50S ribosomal protein L4 [Acidiferrobacterales bacterium]